MRALSAHSLALLSSFDVDPVRGFLPTEDPLPCLTQSEFALWESLVCTLPSLLSRSKNENVRDAILQLPSLPDTILPLLTKEPERRRALLLFATITHAFVWGVPEEPAVYIPQIISVPFCELANAMSLPPVMTHSSLVLYNWRRVDANGPIAVENLKPLCQFLGGPDEAWFYLLTANIEAAGGPAMGAILEAQEAIRRRITIPQLNGNEYGRNNDSSHEGVRKAQYVNAEEEVVMLVEECLRHIETCIRGMHSCVIRMSEGCKPSAFYQKVRPFLSGWKSNPTLPNGVIYEGIQDDDGHAAAAGVVVDGNGNIGAIKDGKEKEKKFVGKRMQFYGGSAAQCSLLPAIDMALGVDHKKHSSSTFLMDMRSYMPLGHRRFLEFLSDSARPSIRTFVQTIADKMSSQVVDIYGSGGRCSGGGGGEKLRSTSEAITACKVATGDNQHATNSCSEVSDTSPLHLKQRMLVEAYEDCLKALDQFRTSHLGIVTLYILQQQEASSKQPHQQQTASDAANVCRSSSGGGGDGGDSSMVNGHGKGSVGGGKTNGTEKGNDYDGGHAAGGKGTGGTPLMQFLKPLRDDVREAKLSEHATVVAATNGKRNGADRLTPPT